MSENCTVDGNVSVNVNIPFTGHIAKNCLLSNNIAVNNDETTIRLMQSENFSFKNNLIISKKAVIFYIKSYMPEEKYTLNDCAAFSGDVICAPDIKVVPEEKTDITRLDNIDFTQENTRFVFKQKPNEISNRYIITPK